MSEASLLGDRYELGELLGYGGMAEVHRSHDTRLDRSVAIKVLRVDLARDPNFQKRFRREAQNAASLSHQSIVAVYDTGEQQTLSGALPYIVMEYVEGRTLKDVLIDEGRLMPRRAFEIGADVCAALDFSHRNGIVHRDIKPANVMVTKDGSVKVMDFGIARAVDSVTSTMTQTSAVIGTAQYLSPEQARGETVDARSDVYSTGCLLYELVVGKPPFTGDNPVAVAYQHVREDPVPPAELNTDLTPGMNAVILKALAKNPVNRYQTAAEMRADLIRAATGLPVAAPPVLSEAERSRITSRVDAVPAPTGRRAARWGLVVLTVLAVFALAAGGTAFILNRTQQITVPSIIGKTQKEADAQLRDLGLVPQFQQQASRAQPKGRAFDQQPPEGATVRTNDRVTVFISTGPQQVTVPNVGNRTIDDAADILTKAGLRVDRQPRPGVLPAGQVTGTSPPAGKTVEENTPVDVYYSDGTQVAMPDVTGKSRAVAQQQLEAAGFTVSIATATSVATPGQVISQDPEAGTPVKRQSTVTITIAVAPPAPSPSVTTPSPGQSSPAPSVSSSPSIPPPAG
jgi:serine/threonine-protein kinase